MKFDKGNNNDNLLEFKNKIINEFVIGPFSKTTDTAFIECMGFAGFDFVIIDLEHGPNSFDNLKNLIMAAQLTKILPIVRIKENSYEQIGAVLDLGAAGVQVPHVKNSKNIREIISYAKFQPLGMRGLCRFVRAANYSSQNRNQYILESQEKLLIIQLEGLEAVENLDEILNEPGYDILFIGPYDLSQSLGFPGKINHSTVQAKIDEIVSKSVERNIIVGTFTDNINDAIYWVKKGIKYISYSVDVGIFYESTLDLIQKIKKGVEIRGGKSG